MPDIRRRSRGGSPVCTQRLCPAKSFTQSLLSPHVARRKKARTRPARLRPRRRRPRAKAEARPKGPDLRAIAVKWQAAWEKAHVYVARADPARPKWYSTVPYPYMNGFQHLGFGTSFLRAEFQSRYRRMLGYNVLHPQAF